MKLFGLIESMQPTGLFGYNNSIPVPHEELFDHIKDYPTAWDVGLQLETPEKIIKISPVIFQNQKIYLDIYEHFKKRGNKI